MCTERSGPEDGWSEKKEKGRKGKKRKKESGAQWKGGRVVDLFKKNQARASEEEEASGGKMKQQRAKRR